MNSLKLKLVILACVIMNTANSFTNTDNTKKNNKESVKIEKTVSDKSESDNDDVKEESILNVQETNDNSKEENEEVQKQLTKYSQRDDNIIDIKALVHEETPDYRIVNGSNVRLILKTKNNDVYSAQIIYSGGEKMMRSIGNYGGNEIFIAEIPNTVKEYYFKLVDGKVKYFYGEMAEWFKAHAWNAC